MRLRSRFGAGLAVVALVGLLAPAAQAADWSNTEMHLQYGSLDTPFLGFIEPGLEEDKDTLILTLQHASGWKYGDNFFFFDVLLADEGINGFNDNDIYGEWYPYFSFRKMGGKERGSGALGDVRLITGLNYAGQARVLKFLPGIGLSWNAGGGFNFLNTDITAYIDASAGTTNGGVPKEDDSFMIDVNWRWATGNNKFSIEGHAEYIGERDNEFGGTVEAWILAQPQFRYYVQSNFAIGVELQYWMNKLGDPDTDETAIQALVVWAF